MRMHRDIEWDRRDRRGGCCAEHIHKIIWYSNCVWKHFMLVNKLSSSVRVQERRWKLHRMIAGKQWQTVNKNIVLFLGNILLHRKLWRTVYVDVYYIYTSMRIVNKLHKYVWTHAHCVHYRSNDNFLFGSIHTYTHHGRRNQQQTKQYSKRMQTNCPP